MKILFLTDNFPPEHNPPANRTYAHSRIWVQQGHEVTVVTCFPNFPIGRLYEGYRQKLWDEEYIDGIRVVRIWSYIAPNRGVLRRSVDYLSYAIHAAFRSLRLPQHDLLVATSPQFFTAVAGRAVAAWRRMPWIMEVRDLWPDSIRAVGAIRTSLVLRMLEYLERHLYRHADALVVVTEAIQQEIAKKADIPLEKIHVVPNGVDTQLFYPTERDEELKRQLGIEGKFVVGYVGTHGMAHGLDGFIRGADRLPKGVILLCIGEGAEKEKLERLARDRSNVLLLPSVPHQQIRRYMSLIDVALVPLRKREVFTTVIPSKIFEAAAMGIPILLGVEGQAQELIERYGAGLCFEPENIEDFHRKLWQLYSDDALYRRCAEGALRLSAHYDRHTQAMRMLEIMERIVHQRNNS